MISSKDIAVFEPFKNLSEEELANSLMSAVVKPEYLHSKNKRSLVEIIDHTFRGDLARDCLIHFFNEKFGEGTFTSADVAKGSMTIPDQEYDIWHNVATMDNPSENVHMIEVKSSFMPLYFSLNDAVKHNKMVVPAETFNGSVIDLSKISTDIFMQVLFYNFPLPENLKEEHAKEIISNPKNRLAKIREFMQFDKRYRFAYLAGWAPTVLIANRVDKLEQKTWNFGTKKHYNFPLSEALSLETYKNE